MSVLDRERDALEQGAYARRLRVAALAASDGEASVSMPVHEAAINRSGRVHGGAIASVMFVAGRLAAASSERVSVDRVITCLQSHVAFLDVPRDTSVLARARVLRRGRDIVHVAAESCASDGTEIARTSLTYVFSETKSLSIGTGRAEMPIDEPGESASMSASPYLSTAGVTRLAPEGRIARLRVPYALNDAVHPPRVDDGAIAGLVDSCAAFASYLDEGIDLSRNGLTVSMSISTLGASSEDLLGRAWVVSRAGECRVAQVEVLGTASGRTVATGTAVYRLVSDR